MIKKSELYTQSKTEKLMFGTKQIGTAHTRYEVREVTDVHDLGHVRRYHITCTQRLVIPNQDEYKLTPNKLPNAFNAYPALLSSQFLLTPAWTPSDGDVRLLNYSPRTLNSTITASTNQSDGTNQSNTLQNTSGSSTSETNTFGVSASLGFFGDLPTGSDTFDMSHSETSEYSNSTTTGTDRGRSTERGDSDSMSVKDWASYAYLDSGNTTPTWVWGQEYPWDVVQYRYCPNNDEVKLPDFVLARMFDNIKTPALVFPPSQLSLFGIDFTMKAAWRTALPSTITEQTVKIKHILNYVIGTHLIQSGKPFASLSAIPPITLESPELKLTELGLDPIPDSGAQNGAVIGFIRSKFVTPPPNNGSAFKIISEANALQVSGSGFDSPMLTNFNGAVKLKVEFKIVDTLYDYALFMKHWKTTDRGCMLTFVFNGNEGEPVIRHVDWKEGEGGEDNLSSIVMRNKDYTSIDYHDYLVMGLNTIDITITPDEGAGSVGYCLRALAIGEE
jgi:hypothetical protein